MHNVRMISQTPQLLKALLLPLLSMVLAACSIGHIAPPMDPLWSDQLLKDSAAVYAGNDKYIRLLHESRTWVGPHQLKEDTIELGKRAEIPVQHANVKILGPTQEDALRSLALKIWMIEQAQHTVDVVYYIFKQDLVGQAILGALCNAVQRGVDVRIMVDAAGSYSITHNDLRKLMACAGEAGYMRDTAQQVTEHRARVQAVVFNAMTSTTSWVNRRSHDKLLIADGAFPDKALVMTGGRNISLDYYGINSDGSPDPTAYRDLEILLQPYAGETYADTSIGDVSGTYYNLLFMHKGNKRLRPMQSHQGITQNSVDVTDYKSAQRSLETLKAFPEIQRKLADMPTYLKQDMRDAQVRLAHELANLTNRNVVRKTQENLATNENSIVRLIDEVGYQENRTGVLRIVSPYMFMAKYYDDQGEVILDDARSIHEWLEKNPQNRIEIITNSVLTSDNFMAQSIIDMDMAPRLLLTPDIEADWLSVSENNDVPPELVNSETWKQLVNNPRIHIYQTGKLDSIKLGTGTEYYGKLHAKFIVGVNTGFVGTANFDYRSRLFNNEMGFFYRDDELHQDLIDTFELLKASSYLWGSPEWLEMRRQVMKVKGMKGWSTRKQRGIFKFMRATGIDWLI